MVTRKGLLKVIGLCLGMTIAAHTMHFFGMGTQIEVREINGVPTNVVVN